MVLDDDISEKSKQVLEIKKLNSECYDLKEELYYLKNDIDCKLRDHMKITLELDVAPQCEQLEKQLLQQNEQLTNLLCAQWLEKNKLLKNKCWELQSKQIIFDAQVWFESLCLK